MSSLFTSLAASGGALSAFTRSLEAIQNNVSNASTPGYARQNVRLETLPVTGVKAGELESARNEYAEKAVREKLQTAGYLDQKVDSLAALENTFDISGKSGIPGALNDLFQSFSAWSVNPNDTALRATVIENARTLAQSFHTAAGEISKAATDADRQVRSTVDQINTLASQLRQYNSERLRLGKPDAALDAKVHATLEELSQLVDFDVLQPADGTVTVLVGGQTPLVLGDQQFALGSDENSLSGISGGKLAGLLEVRNQTAPQLGGDLNKLATAVANRVNSLLTSGLVSAGPPSVQGVPLFTYDATSAARTLAIDPGIDAGRLAAMDAGPPAVSNGIALQLAGLASPTASADQIDGFSYVEFYGNIAGVVGNRLAVARDGSETQRQLVAQARSLRDQASGVSLDEEAVHLIEMQRAYQATARMVSVLNDLTETTVNLLR